MKFPTVEIEKRDRDDHTDTLIKSLLDEEKASKKQKRGPPQEDAAAKPAVQARKGKTFAEIEAEEGGPIKESLVGMAHTKRALDRKKRDLDVGDTDVLTNTERYEKDTLDVEQEDGITFEPFNLKQEREEGYFDDDGNYVLRKQGAEEGEDEKDAWLNSDEAKVVSDKVRKKIEEQRALAEEAARRGPLTERQIAQRKADIAAMMSPGETVTRALKRLGGGSGPNAGASTAATGLPHRAMGKRQRARLLAQQQQQQQQQGADAMTTASAGRVAPSREQFAHMTELADELLEEGELEIYDATKEELLRSARIWLPQLAAAGAGMADSPLPARAAAGGGASGSIPSNAGNDDDDDMFVDEDEKPSNAGSKGFAAVAVKAVAALDEDQDMFGDEDEGEPGCGQDEGAVAAAAGAVGASTAGVSSGIGDGGGVELGAQQRSTGGSMISAGMETAAAAAAVPGDGEAAVDYATWPVKELKRLLQERGVDPSGFVEKVDLVAKVKEVVDETGPAGACMAGRGGSKSAFVAPPGYVYDPSSGYFYSEESGMYYDISSGGYFQASTGKWFYLDSSSSAFVEWKQ